MLKIHKTLLLLSLLLSSCGNGAINYYFDPVGGDDSNSGTSPGSPFRSLAMVGALDLKGGDSVLLKGGAIFREQLLVSCRGEETQAVVVGAYGRGRPHIEGGGRRRDAVHILNCENIVIRDLEISNRGEAPVEGANGLLLELRDYGVARGVALENLYVHDVWGSVEIEKGGGRAIGVRNAHNAIQGDSIPSNFDGLRIENCLIRDCQRDGIRFESFWRRGVWFPNLRVTIRGNTLDGVPGDGIVPVGCDGALVEYNVMKNCPATLPPSEACDGIWPWSCSNTTVQFNVVSDHKSVVDAYAYDSDWNSINNLFQYNLSYNNLGGFMLIIGTDGWPADWCVGNIGTRSRYNISINDGLRDYTTDGVQGYFSPVINQTGLTENTVIEKNLFYQLPKPEAFIDRTILHQNRHDSQFPDSTAFRGNYIFVAQPTVAVKEEMARRNFFSDNVFVGPLETHAQGFIRHAGGFDSNMWYDPADENWDKLIEFVKDKSVPLDGRLIPVTEIIGWRP